MYRYVFVFTNKQVNFCFSLSLSYLWLWCSSFSSCSLLSDCHIMHQNVITHTEKFFLFCYCIKYSLIHVDLDYCDIYPLVMMHLYGTGEGFSVSQKLFLGWDSDKSLVWKGWRSFCLLSGASKWVITSATILSVACSLFLFVWVSCFSPESGHPFCFYLIIIVIAMHTFWFFFSV